MLTWVRKCCVFALLYHGVRGSDLRGSRERELDLTAVSTAVLETESLADYTIKFGFRWLPVTYLKTHSEAVQYCMNEGYDGIASPLSDEQNTYMNGMFDHDEIIWYGPTCQGSGCNTISTWSLPYSNFHSGQPNCNKASCNVCARSQNAGYTSWNDGNCVDKYRFVCRSAIWNLVSGDYFMAVDAPMTHSSAVAFCESQTTLAGQNPVLASPQTPDQKTYMENQFPD